MSSLRKIVIAVSLLLGVAEVIGQTLAFPEALGYGRYTTGGRAGTVYHVTNLNDSGSGSFRDAVSQSNRIIVFDVGGYISLKSAVSINSNITIAGQTAPGGIGIKSGKLSCGGKTNIIIRHLRMRPGSETAKFEDVAMNILNANNIIFDHCSFEFAPWNNIDGVSTNWQKTPVDNITFQSCLIANPTGQQFGAHCETSAGEWSWFYCAFVNTHNRNPLAKNNNVFINNIEYNYQAAYTTHTSAKFNHDIIGNYFIYGPTSKGNTWFQIDKNQSIYCKDNLLDKSLDGKLNGTTTNVSWYKGTGTILDAAWSDVAKSVTIYSPATAYRMVSSLSGAYPWDQLDSLIWSQVQTLGAGTSGYGAGTRGPAGMYGSQTSTGLPNNGYGKIYGQTKPLDTDNDGMPNFWEKTNGLDTVKNDAMVKGSDGYVNIERYLNWLGALHEKVFKNSYVDIDLAKYTSGFSKVSPVYLVKNAENGTAVLNSDGHTVRFTPTVNYAGMASFNFTVTGNDNTAYTTNISLAVIPDKALPPPTPKKYIYTYDNSGNALWTNANNWSPVAVPTSIDTTVIRTGEIKIADMNITTPVFVEPNGILRLTDTCAISYLKMQGGTLKMFTSNPCFVLKSAIDVQSKSTFLVGSQVYSSFELQGTISGSSEIVKTGIGTLRIVGSASAFKGLFRVTAGGLQIKNANGLGQCGVEIDSAATLDVKTACTTFSLTAKNKSIINLDANLTVQAAVIGTENLSAGTYTAASHPTFITGKGSLIVQKSLVAVETLVGGQIKLTATPAATYEWSDGKTVLSTSSTYSTATSSSIYLKVINATGCSVSSTVIRTDGPTVSILTPTTTDQLFGNANIQITAKAASLSGTVTKVDYYNGANLIGSASTEPYSFTWSNVAIGQYTITAKVTDSKGLIGVSAPIVIVVKQKPQRYVYEYDNSSNYTWANTNAWTPKALPSSIDTAVVRTGEVRIAKMTIQSPVIIEPNGILRLTDSCIVNTLFLEGGILKAHTSTPCFRLISTIKAVVPSTIWCGSAAATVFELQGSIYGSANISKTNVGVLKIMASGDSLKGKWLLKEGTLQAMSASALGLCGVVAESATKLDIKTDVSTYSLVLKTGAILNLDADLTVDAAIIGDKNIPTGSYTAADFPNTITGTGTLNVQNSILEDELSYDGSIMLTSSSGETHQWFSGVTAVSTETSYRVTTSGTYSVESVSSEGCSVSAQPVALTVAMTKDLSIVLQKGWNLISINVIPSDSTIETIFAGLDVLEVKSTNGFWRKNQNAVFNSLQKILPSCGYFVNMNSAATLSVKGLAVDNIYVIDSTITGWQLIGCPYQSATSFYSDFDVNNCQTIKNFEGFWIPGDASSSLLNAEPGKGYFLYK